VERVVGPDADLSFGAVGDTPVAHIRGEIDLANADAIGAAIFDFLSNQEIDFVADLSDVTYVDSAGIRMLFELSRSLEEHRQRLVVVVPPGSLVRRSLEVGGLLASVTIAETLGDLENADRG
jgi:anti-anti-sigma factor